MLKNGELLAAAEARFDVFITTDKNLRHQQNLTGRKFAVVLLPSNQVPIVEALIPAIDAALAAAQRPETLSRFRSRRNEAAHHSDESRFRGWLSSQPSRFMAVPKQESAR